MREKCLYRKINVENVLIDVWNGTIIVLFYFYDTLAIFFIIFAGLIIILFLILCIAYGTPYHAIGHQILFFVYQCYLRNVMPRHWSPGDLPQVLRFERVFFTLGCFYLTLFPAFSRLYWGWQFSLVWIRQQSTNLIFSNKLYLNMIKILINCLCWRV